MEAAAKPLPSDETTPPVTKMYFAGMTTSAMWEICVAGDCKRPGDWRTKRRNPTPRNLTLSGGFQRGARPIMNGIDGFGKKQIGLPGLQ
jgi:hypothetical protein